MPISKLAKIGEVFCFLRERIEIEPSVCRAHHYITEADVEVFCLTGQVSKVGVPMILKILPISAKSLNPPSNKASRFTDPTRDTYFMKLGVNCSSSDSGEGRRVGPICVKKLAIATPSDHLSSAKGSYACEPNRSSGAR
jgi:hypothetical protein